MRNSELFTRKRELYISRNDGECGHDWKPFTWRWVLTDKTTGNDVYEQKQYANLCDLPDEVKSDIRFQHPDQATGLMWSREWDCSFNSLPSEMRRAISKNGRIKSMVDAAAEKDSYRRPLSRQQRILYEYGIYNFVRMPQSKLFMPDCDPAALARAFFIGCYDTRSENFSRSDIGLQSSSLRNAFEKIQTSGLFTGDPAPRNFNTSIMWRGKHDALIDSADGKLFIETYRSLCSSTPPRRHVYIGRLIQLLPLCGRLTNVLCLRETTGIYRGDMVLSRQAITDLFHIGKNNLSRFMDAMFSLEFERHGETLPAFYEVEKNGVKFLCVHPYLWYAGSISDGDQLLVPYYKRPRVIDYGKFAKKYRNK